MWHASLGLGLIADVGILRISGKKADPLVRISGSGFAKLRRLVGDDIVEKQVTMGQKDSCQSS